MRIVLHYAGLGNPCSQCGTRSPLNKKFVTQRKSKSDGMKFQPLQFTISVFKRWQKLILPPLFHLNAICTLNVCAFTLTNFECPNTERRNVSASEPHTASIIWVGCWYKLSIIATKSDCIFFTVSLLTAALEARWAHVHATLGVRFWKKKKEKKESWKWNSFQGQLILTSTFRDHACIPLDKPLW